MTFGYSSTRYYWFYLSDLKEDSILTSKHLRARQSMGTLVGNSLESRFTKVFIAKWDEDNKDENDIKIWNYGDLSSGWTMINSNTFEEKRSIRNW